MTIQRTSGTTGPPGHGGPPGISQPGYVSGSYYGGAAVWNNSLLSASAANGTCFYIPFYVSETTTFDRIAVWQVTAGSAGSVFRMGIYDDSGLGTPGPVRFDAGTVDTATGANDGTLRTITLSALTLGSGWRWLAGVQQGAPATRAVMAQLLYVGSPPVPYDATGQFVPPTCLRLVTTVTGAFANNPAASSSSANAPAILMRAA